jgi:hypothetical protein
MISSGLVDMNTAFNIYSYALSWMTLGIEEDSESEEN